MKRGRSREMWGLFALFAVFVVSTVAFQRVAQETVGRDAPSSMNSQGPGAKALFLLLARLGYSPERLDHPWTELPVGRGLLIVTEPFSEGRGPNARETDSLRRWVRQGGAVLYYAAPGRHNPARKLFDPVTVADDAGAPAELAPAAPKSEFVRDISALKVEGKARLIGSPGPHGEVLFGDHAGGVVVRNGIGKGNVIIVADSASFSNAGIAEADNALLALDAAAAAARDNGKRVLFDEYHHGLGFAGAGAVDDDAGLLATAPLSLKLGLCQAVALSVLLVYNGNRRFGPLRSAAAARSRATTDYVGSMAGLLRRGRAGDVAVIALYGRFLRELRADLHISPDLPPSDIPAAAARAKGRDDHALADLVARCEQVVSGLRPSESQACTLACDIETLRRSYNLVGLE